VQIHDSDIAPSTIQLYVGIRWATVREYGVARLMAFKPACEPDFS
jgi:hypothetical protein